MNMDVNGCKIIADGSVMQFLQKISGGTPIDDRQAHTLEEQTLIVYAHALTPSALWRSEHSGLTSLQRLLANNLSQKCPIVVMGWLPKDSYGSFTYLTTQLPYSRLPINDSGCIEPTVVSDGVWHRLRQDAERAYLASCERVLEDACRRIRHQFSELRRPAVRVLLGAWLSGDVSTEVASSVMQQLASNDEKATADGISHILDECKEEYDIVLTKRPARAEEPVCGSGRYLLCDDLVQDGCYRWSDGDVLQVDSGCLGPISIGTDDSGWGPVMACVTRSEIRCFNDPDRMMQMIVEREDIEAVLLDYDLGLDRLGKPVCGARYLAPIRNLRFDLPIVMFTAFDDSTIAKWCLTHGASGYFVKETRESEGRASLMAYASLRKEIQDLPQSPRLKRKLWRKFVLLEERIEALERSAAQSLPAGHPMPAISWNLRQSFYWFMTNAQDPRVGEDAGPGDGERTVNLAVHSANAFDELLRCHYYMSGHTFSWDAMTASNRDGIEGRIACSGLSFGRYPGEMAQVEPYAHFKADLSSVSLAKATKCLDGVLRLIESYLARYCSGAAIASGSEQNRLPPPTCVPVPPQDTRSGSENHARTAELGAEDLVLGMAEILGLDTVPGYGSPEERRSFLETARDLASARNSQEDRWHEWRARWLGNQNAYRLLFIDNKPEPWVPALKLLFGENGVDECKLSAVPDSLSRLPGVAADLDKEYDLVLLDLCMPEPEVGNKVLRLFAEETGLPVVLLTASDEAGWTSKCLREGAVNYFLKRQPENERYEGAIRLSEMVWDLSTLFGRCSEIRAVWNGIRDIADQEPGLCDQSKLLRYLTNTKGWGVPPAECTATSWIGRVINDKLKTIYAALLGASSHDFNPNHRIDVFHWALKGLMVSRYETFLTPTAIPPHCLILALECGKLVEGLTNLAEKVDPRYVWPRVGRDIWKERHTAAHGNLAPTALAVANPVDAANRALGFAREWRAWIGQQIG